MAHLQYFNYAGYGETAKENYHYSQAVRVGDSIHCSGQGGWDRQTSKLPDDEEAQIDQAFDNVQEALRVAGVENGWEKVYKVTSYHVPVSDTGISAMIRNLRKYCPGHQPVWTLIGPAKLAFPEMKVEIQVEAHVATGAAK